MNKEKSKFDQSHQIREIFSQMTAVLQKFLSYLSIPPQVQKKGTGKLNLRKLQEPHNKALNISISSFLPVPHRLDSQFKYTLCHVRQFFKVII